MLRLRNIDNGLKHHEFYSNFQNGSFIRHENYSYFRSSLLIKKRQIDFDKII